MTIVSSPNTCLYFSKQSTLKVYPKHLAIIMDGNRRWAAREGQPSSIGHKVGAENTKVLLKELLKLPLECITLFAFASANWQRSRLETDALLKLASEGLGSLHEDCENEDAKIEFIGCRDRLPPHLLVVMERLE